MSSSGVSDSLTKQSIVPETEEFHCPVCSYGPDEAEDMLVHIVMNHRIRPWDRWEIFVCTGEQRFWTAKAFRKFCSSAMPWLTSPLTPLTT